MWVDGNAMASNAQARRERRVSEWLCCCGRADLVGVDTMRNACVRHFIRICDHHHALAIFVQLRHFRYLGPGYGHNCVEDCRVKPGDTLEGPRNNVIQTRNNFGNGFYRRLYPARIHALGIQN
jgi:hypothetical protein